ncbi:hypothetical protein NC651_002971 [Populus alba x Populus x berolinensis]|nr:hypothetical protein NC651_002971 [Populus alba x Populus x berolinensis]
MAVGGAAKVGVFAPFPVKDQLPGVDSCVSSSPSWPKAILLGFQHYLVMLGTTVIIPSIFVLSISRGNVEKAEMINTLLFVAGINTLLQTWFGTRLPVVIGGPYAFSIPTITISLSTNNSTNVIFRTPRQLAKCVVIGIPALLIVVFISQLYGYMPAVLAVAGAYNSKHPDTQLSCRVDHAGLISAAPCLLVQLLRYQDMGVPLLCLLLYSAVVLDGCFCWSGISPVLQLNSFRTKFILGFSLFLGLPVPQYFKEYLLVSGRGPVHTGATWLLCRTSQPAETVAGTGGRGSDILVKTPGVRSSIQFDCQNASIHGRFRVLACDPGCLPVEGSIIFATTHKELHSHSFTVDAQRPIV